MPRGRRIPSAALVSAALLVVNALAYALTVVAARVLGPAGYGELAALLAVLLVGSVAAGGVHASTALALGRRRGTGPVDCATTTSTAVHAAHTVALVVAAVGSVLALLAAPLVVALLHLAGPTAALLLVTLIGPHVLLGAYEGICTGTGRYRRAATASLVFGLAKTTGAVAGLGMTRNVDGTLTGMALGSLVGLAAAWAAAGRPGVAGADVRGGLRTVGAATGALLGFTVLLNLDLVLARHHFPAREAGEYAVGAVLGKIAFWLPQGVGVVLLPRLAGGSPRTALLRAVAVVSALGAVGTVLVAVLGERALTLIGGAEHGSLGDVAWLFPAGGTLLGVAQLAVFSALANRDAGTTGLVWAVSALEVCAVGGAAATGRLSPVTLLVTAVAAAAALCASAGWRAVRRTSSTPAPR